MLPRSLLLVFGLLTGSCGSPPAGPLDGGTPEFDAGATDAGEHPGDGGTVAVDCATYCALLHEHCPEEMIHPEEACEYLCDHPVATLFESIGTADDTNENTLGCRIHHAQVAGSLTGEAKGAACAAANLSGGDVCGTYCANYCTLVMSECIDTNAAYMGEQLYADEEECLSACEGFSTEVLEGTAQTEQMFGYGDTVQCRLHHAQAAALQDLYSLHCPHASEGSTDNTCSDIAPPNIPNYCAFALEFCVEGVSNPLFEAGTTQMQCQNIMGALVDDLTYDEGPFSTFTESSGASLGCLNYWIVQAPLDPEANCAKADYRPLNWSSMGGQGVCHD